MRHTNLETLRAKKIGTPRRDAMGWDFGMGWDGIWSILSTGRGWEWEWDGTGFWDGLGWDYNT